MVQHHKFIDIVHKLGEKGYELKGVYRRIQDRDLFLMAVRQRQPMVGLIHHSARGSQYTGSAYVREV